jgi:hypothetical protein
MKNAALFIVISLIFGIFACSKKDSESEKFKLLTAHPWVADSLLVNGADASGPGGMLESFVGDVVFNTDYTGTFGQFTGTWRFAFNETQLIIDSDSLAFPMTAVIVELTSVSLKATTSYQIPGSDPINIRMTFKPK